MADAFTLGNAPQGFVLRLSKDADFVAGIIRPDGTAWPSTAVATVKVGAASWDAARTTTTAPNDTLSWNIDKVLVNAVLATRPSSAKLYYVDGATELLWATGPVADS